MITAEKIAENAANHWRDNKGVGSAIIPPPMDDKAFLLYILAKVLNNNENANVLIIVNNFKERLNVIEYITTQEDEEDNLTIKKLLDSKVIRIFTSDYINHSRYSSIYTLCILYNIEDVSYSVISQLKVCKFKLVIMNKVITHDNMSKLYSLCPMLPDFKQNELDALRLSTPIEDMWIGVSIPEDSEDFKLLKYYDEYINTSLNIFGSFEIMQQARVGNSTLNISANQICSDIAKENGWNEYLDMSVDINVQLDALYNPNALKDRASETYEIIRNRACLLASNENKIDEIINICSNHEKSRILIINKKGEFAAKLTDVINNYYGYEVCGNYHDRVQPIPMLDDNARPVLYKSGRNKGKPKFMGYQAQKTNNVKRFNNGELTIMSTNGAPDKELNINVDVIIITSPLCESIEDYVYRLSKVYYPNKKIILYSLYVKNSLEQSKLQSKTISEIHTIVNKCENSVVSKNNSDYIIVD